MSTREAPPRLRADEVREILPHYELGKVHAVRELLAGATRAPKALVESDRGKFVLKRRASGRDHPLNVALSHEVQLHLTVAQLPVARLIGTRDENNSMLQTGYHVYEMTMFVQGLPYGRKPERAAAAGSTLARVHEAWAGFEPTTALPPQRDPTLPLIEHTLRSSESEAAELLLSTARLADENLTRILIEAPSSEAGLIHGDVHPGNFLFIESTVAAFFDFDGVQLGPRTHDIAQGLAQFSLTRTGPTPEHWRPEADLTLAAPFLGSYLSQTGWTPPPAAAWPFLMAESLVYEACRTPLPENVLRAVARKAAWLEQNHQTVVETLSRSLP